MGTNAQIGSTKRDLRSVGYHFVAASPVKAFPKTAYAKGIPMAILSARLLFTCMVRTPATDLTLIIP
jgi:hypothetical protein